MRRLLRWTFHALAAASLLLCLATAGLWVRSYWGYDRFIARRLSATGLRRGVEFPKYQGCIGSYRGRLGGWFQFSGQPEGQRAEPWEFEVGPADEFIGSIRTRFPFRTYRGVYVGCPYTVNYWSLPDWSLVSAFALLPSIATFRQVRVARRRRRARLGRCVACGYDLRATPERCPDCGVIPGKGAA